VKQTKPEPQPGGFEGSLDNRCPYCSFQPTSDSDFCSKHKPKYRGKVKRED